MLPSGDACIDDTLKMRLSGAIKLQEDSPFGRGPVGRLARNACRKWVTRREGAQRQCPKSHAMLGRLESRGANVIAKSKMKVWNSQNDQSSHTKMKSLKVPKFLS